MMKRLSKMVADDSWEYAQVKMLSSSVSFAISLYIF